LILQMMEQAGPDSLRAVLDSVFADPAYRWAERPALLGWLDRGWRWLTSALQQFQDDNPVLFHWFYLALIAILAVIILHAAWVVFRTTRAAVAREQSASATAVRAPLTPVWYVERSRELAADGRFAEALMTAFQALVLDLDRRGMVRYRAGKTPREYVREPTLDPADRERMGDLVHRLYRYVFGHEPCGQQEYQAWLEAAGGRWRAAPA